MADVNRMTVGQAVRQAAAMLSKSETAFLDARTLMKSASGYDDAEMITHSEELLNKDIEAAYWRLVARRSKNEPVAYILGYKEFWSMRFEVSPDVLIPRPDSERLIEAVAAARAPDMPLSILDLGVGSGCLLCALLSVFPNAKGIGVDRSHKALGVARRNATHLGFSDRAHFIQGDWTAGIEGAFDVIVANPPYISEDEAVGLMADVADYEPREALVASEKGLAAYHAILRGVPDLLAEGGLAILEIGATQEKAVKLIVSKYLQNAAIMTIHDLGGRPRGVIAEKKS